MKACSKCKQTLPIDQFGIQKASKWIKSDRPKSRCRKCESIGVEESRQKTKLTDPEKFRRKQNRTIEYNYTLTQRNLAYVSRYLRRFGKCVDCGMTDTRVLEFDHIQGEKVDGVVRLASQLASISKIKDEIRKCEIRCCNCHRIKTQQQFGWRENWKDSWLK
jgi:hypothetical protein